MTPPARRPQRAARAPRPRQQPVHIKDLIPDPENRRAHNPRNIGMIVDGLQQVGAARSIVLDDDDVILAGNGVIEAAAEAGITKVRVIEADGNEIIAVRRRGLTAEQKRKLAMYDNRTAELAEWNWEQLGKDKANELDLAPWFSAEELAHALGKTVHFGDSDPDDVPERRATGIQFGDVFELGRHRLVCGDSTRMEYIECALGDRKPDQVFTDPPYGVNVTGKGGNAIAGDISFTLIPLMFDVLDKVLAPKAWCYVCGGQSNMSLYSRLFERYFRELPKVIVWNKGKTAVMRRSGYHSCYEFIYFAFREGGGHRWFTTRTSDDADDMWHDELDPQAKRVHPTQKPVALSLRAIRNTCPAEGLVFEPFAGSGSTLIGAEQAGRDCIAIEIDPVYVQVIVDRWEAFTGQKAMKVGEVCAAGSRRHQS